MRKILILISLVLFSALSFGQGAMMGSVGASGGDVPAVLTNTDSTLGYYLAATANITTDGQDSVTVWNDLSGNDNHLLATDETGASPYFNPSGDSVYFNGVLNYMNVAIATLDQPMTYYMIIKQVTFTTFDRLFDGGADGSVMINQNPSTPNLRAFAGSYSTSNNSLTLDTWKILRVTFNGASSSLQIDETAAVTGNFGSNDANGFTLGGGAGGVSQSHIAVKAVILSIATGSQTKSDIYDYLVSLL